MDESTIIGFISLGLLMAINLTVSAFNAGKLSQKVSDHERRLEGIEKLKPDIPPCSFHIQLEKEHIELKGRVDAHLENS